MLNASPAPGAEEYAIHDHEGFTGYPLGEYENLAFISRLAQGIAGTVKPLPPTPTGSDAVMRSWSTSPNTTRAPIRHGRRGPRRSPTRSSNGRAGVRPSPKSYAPTSGSP